MPISVGHFVVAQNVHFRGFMPFRKALVVVSINKRVRVRNPDEPDGRTMLLWPNEVLAYYENREDADLAAAAASDVWKGYETQIKALHSEQVEAVRWAAKERERFLKGKKD